jgi:hypothetical protein
MQDQHEDVAEFGAGTGTEGGNHSSVAKVSPRTWSSSMGRCWPIERWCTPQRRDRRHASRPFARPTIRHLTRDGSADKVVEARTAEDKGKQRK